MSAKQRIYYLSASRIPSRAANAVNVMRMCSAMAAFDRDVTLFADGGESAGPFAFYSVPDNFRIVFVKKPRLRVVGTLLYAWRVKQALLKQGLPTLFYGRHMYSLALTARSGVPFIVEAHKLPSNAVQCRLEAWLTRRQNFRRLVVISNVLAEDYRVLFPWLTDKQVLVAHDGAQKPEYPVVPVHPWPGRPGVFQVGYTGALYPGKGVEIIAELAEKCRQYDFHIVGGRESELASWRLRSMPSNLFFHGFVPHGQLSAYIAHFDVALAPLQPRVTVENGKRDIGRWTSPLKIFEYMAQAKAIIVSDLPVLREIIEDGQTGLLVPPDSVDAWCRALDRLADSPELINSLGRRARRCLLRKFTWQKRTESVLS
jgi:glycosyltransferase involved in cell wall biosynthesis